MGNGGVIWEKQIGNQTWNNDYFMVRTGVPRI
jgi:hypothetical protein